MITLNDICQGHPKVYDLIQDILRKFPLVEAEAIFQEMWLKGLTGETLWKFYEETHLKSLKSMVDDLGFGVLWRD